MHIERRSRPGALEHRVAWLARQHRRTHLRLAVVLLVEGQLLPCVQLCGVRRRHTVVEAGNQDPPLRVLQLRDHLRQRDKRIGRRASVHPRMQVGLRAPRLDFGVDHPPQPDAERRQLGSEHLRVGNQREIRLQPLRVVPDELRDRFSADLLLTLENHAHIERQPTGRREQRLQGLHMDIHLPFVVHRAARVEIAVPLDRLEGRRNPLVQRIGRLHIVVPVGQAGRLALGMQPVRIDQRMSRAAVLWNVDQLDVLHPNPRQLGGQHLGRVANVALVFGQRRNRGNAEQRLQFVKKAGLVGAGVVEGGRHALSPRSSLRHRSANPHPPHRFVQIRIVGDDRRRLRIVQRPWLEQCPVLQFTPETRTVVDPIEAAGKDNPGGQLRESPRLRGLQGGLVDFRDAQPKGGGGQLLAQQRYPA